MIKNYGGNNYQLGINCPECGKEKSMSYQSFFDAINHEKRLRCGDCDIEFIVTLDLLVTSARTPHGAEAPKQSGLDREQDMYECGNCGVARFVHNGILEACPNCGDDETELSLYDDVP